MLWPSRLLIWGNTRGSFYPVLAQHVGRRSTLLTFEHVSDPAFRQTLVVDNHSGIATRLIGYDHGLIVTSVSSLDAWDPEQQPTFDPITAPIEPDY